MSEAIEEWVVRINENCYVIPYSFPVPFYQLTLEVEPKSIKNLPTVPYNNEIEIAFV